MQNIIHHSQLTSAPTKGRRSGTRVLRIRRESQRRRERKTAVPSLVALGIQVDSPARNFPKPRRRSEGFPGPSSVRRVTPLQAAQQNGSKSVHVANPSRRLEQAWLTQHHAAYAGAWVALQGARLVACGSSAQQVLDAARSDGYDQPLVVHIPGEPPLPFGGW